MSKIAIVGTGIAGMTTAYLLAREHEVTVFEARDRIGGHTHTVAVEGPDGVTRGVDTGFIVFNPRRYPTFIRLLDQLGVASQPTEMSFSVRVPGGPCYGSRGLSGLLAWKRNALRPGFWRMLLGLRRFYREVEAAVDDARYDGATLGEYLEQAGYPPELGDWHLLPMAAAVWSAPLDDIREFPLRTFVEFFANHEFLQFSGRPQWRVIQGGSSTYAEVLTRSYLDRIRLATPVHEVRRDADGVELAVGDGERARFDEVVFACHSDQALGMLADPTAAEREVLGALRYQRNDVTLHSDASVLPARKAAWSAWNVHPVEGDPTLRMTYCMNLLQSLQAPVTYNVSLNASDAIDPAARIRELVYHHPVTTAAAVAAKARWSELSGRPGRTHYCGAYWGYGFHEDGCASGARVAAAFGLEL